MSLPAQAIQPLRERLAFMRAERLRYDNLEAGAIGDAPRIDRAISELEALIKRLETDNGTRRP